MARKRKPELPGKPEDATLKGDDTAYAKVLRMLGDGRVEVECSDGATRIGIIRGKMKKRVWIHPGETVLVGLRDFEDAKCDVIKKYTPDELRYLEGKGELAQWAAAADNDEVQFDVDIDDI